VLEKRGTLEKRGEDGAPCSLLPIANNQVASSPAQDNSPARRDANRRFDLLCLGLLLLVWLVLSIPRLGGPIDLRWDASAYYVLGTALAEGKGYRLLNEPGEIEAVQYPPLLPLTVAAHQRVMATNDYLKVGSALRFSYFVLSGVYLLIIYLLARDLLSPFYSLIVGTASALSFCSFLYPSDALYADLPFSLLFALFLFFHQRSERLLNGAMTGLVAAASYLLRTAGVALLVAWVTASIIQWRFRQAAIRIVVSAIPILLWQGYVWHVTRSYEYRHPTYSYQRADYYYSNVTYGANSRLVDPFCPELGQIKLHDAGVRIAQNLLTVPVSLGESAFVPLSYWRHFLEGSHRRLNAVLPAYWPSLSLHALYWALVVAGLFAVIGALFVALGSHSFLPLVFGITVGLVALTPWQNQFWRYLAPVAPLTLIFLLLTMLQIWHWFDDRSLRWGRIARVLMVTVLTGALLVQAAVAAKLLGNMPLVSYFDASGQERRFRVLAYGRDWAALDDAFEWIRRHATDGEVVATAVPQLAYLRSGHKAVLPPFEPNPATASRLLDQVPVTYLVLDNFGMSPGISERYAAPVVMQIPADWRLVFTAADNKTRVYERIR
jgi:hypothetical protein